MVVPEIDDFLPDTVMDAFLNEVKNCTRHPDKILVSWDFNLYCSIIFFCIIASFFISLKDPGHNLGGLVDFFFYWGLVGVVVEVLAI